MKQAPQLLLVDDDPAFCQVLSRYLQAQGFSVTVAHDGANGLLETTGNTCDLVILDERLPGLSGIEVLRRIRRQGELPVVMLTAKSDEIDCIVAFELGADDYLSKSCNLRELVARLHSILRRTRQTRNAEEMPDDDTTRLGLSADHPTHSKKDVV